MQTPQEWVLAGLLIVARVGGCLMVAPGFSSLRVPVQARLYLCAATSLVLLPLHGPAAVAAMGAQPLHWFAVIASESAIGLSIGLLGRLFFWALETLASAAAMTMGLSNPFAPVEGEASLPAPASFISLAALALFFAADAHHEVLRGLAESYRVAPPGAPFATRASLARIVAVLGEAFMLCLRVTGPMLVFSLVVNFVIGLISRMSPAMQAYFLFTPFMIAAGLTLTALAMPGLLEGFISGLGLRLRFG